MKSFREYAREILTEKLVEDVWDHKIFSEADMQYCAAFWLDKEYFSLQYYLRNQPQIPIGKGRGTANAKPDIVIFSPKHGPVVAFELKCFIANPNLGIRQIADKIWEDIDNLYKFKQRYPESENVFAIAMVHLDKQDFDELRKEFSRDKEEWMKHYLFTHIVNIVCNENGRKRNQYEVWYKEWKKWKEYFDDL
jgi:hypothetical protein